MSRVYAVREDTGKRFLLEIECDHSGCSETIKPHSEITSSGWMKAGFDDPEQGGCFEYDFCPLHALDAAAIARGAK